MTRLLVPIHLSALVERASGEVYAETEFQPANLQVDEPTRQQIFPNAFSLHGTRAPGVHLHWALPDALARYDSAHKRFPRLPCRWVVVRSSGQPASGARRVKAWLLPDIHRDTPAVLPLPAAVPTISGTADLDVRGPDGSDPSWFAYYDNTLGRLAFYDDLADAPTGPINYLVCGWFVRTRNDPLNVTPGPLSEAALRQRLAVLGWDVRGPIEDLPTATLYHGAALSIGWPQPGWPGDGAGTLLPERDARPEPGALQIGLGDRTAAVVSELLTLDDPADAQLVELLIGGELRDLSQLNGAQLAAANAHRARFVTAAQPSDTDEIVFTPASLADPAETPAPVSAVLDVTRPARGGLLEADAVARPRRAARPVARQFAAEGEESIDLDPGELQRVNRPAPRSYVAQDPQLVLLGAGRTYRHGEDGRFGVLGRLNCRVSGDALQVLGRPGETDGVARDLLPKQPGSSTALDLPTSVFDAELRREIEALIVEVHALDPAMNPAVAGEPPVHPLAQLRAEFLAAEARWSMPGVDPGDPPPDVRSEGLPPAPLAITLPERPWSPLHVEWTLDFRASPRGAHDWRLEDLDFEPAGPVPIDAPIRALTGRTILTSTPARLLGDALSSTIVSLSRLEDGQAAIDQLVDLFEATDQDDLLFRFTHLDLIGCQLDGYLDRLRGTPEGTWISKGGIVGSESVRRTAERKESYSATSLVAGTFTPARVRLVDTFGRVLDAPSDAPVTLSQSIRHPDDPAIALQRPRFSAPATLEFRYINPTATGDISEADVRSGQSPLTGFLTPNPFDGSLEFHSATGAALGQLRIDRDGRAVWEESPGTASAVGTPASQSIGDRNAAEQNLAAIAQAIVRADENRANASVQGGALATLLRAIDVARFTVDPTAKAGDQHLQALLGSPVAVLRARVRVSLQDPQRDRSRPISVPLRLGSVGNLSDGLLCFYLTQSPDRLHLIHPAHADAEPLPLLAAVDEPAPLLEADASGLVWVDVERDLDLLLLATPGADVSLTAGLAPSKVLEMQREWVDGPIRQLTPTLRFESVLRDPRVPRFPVATDIHGHWSWYHRTSPVEWTSEQVQPQAGGQLDPTRPAIVQDGYLRVTLVPEQPYTGIPIQVVAIRRTGRAQTIQFLRVQSSTGKQTDLAIDEGVQMVQSGRFAFFTEVEGQPRATVIVDTSPSGRLFLRTDADPTTKNNLDSLPTF